MWVQTIAGLVSGLIKPASEAVGRWQGNRREVNAAKHEARLARIKAQDNSWKDEFVLVVWSAPIIMAFIPQLREHTTESIAFITDLPPWYVGGWVGISMAIYGIAKFERFKK